jgi:uncharacterized protein (DUF1778 family)
MNRPTKPAAEVRSEDVHVRMTVEEKQRIEQYARERGVSLSDYMRMRALRVEI